MRLTGRDYAERHNDKTQRNQGPQLATPHNPQPRIIDIGAAWSKQSNEGGNYLGLKLAPGFTAPIYANVEDEDGRGHSLIWSRPNRRNGD